MSKKFKKVISVFTLLLLTLTLLPMKEVNAAQKLGDRLLVGFWHNFDNGTGIIKLKDVKDSWDVLNVSFGETYTDRAVVEFTPCYDEEEFIQDVKYLQSKGKKVVLSIGGQNGVVLVESKEAKDKFVKSVTDLIKKYNFDGLDIDLESGISLQGGDTDFKNPKTPQIVNLIEGVKEIKANCGSDFILSMAPETAYVQGGITAYGNIWGAYLPIIYGLRDDLTYIHVQHYNAGGNQGLDGNMYTQGTADYEVAMADMLLNGFPVGGNTNNIFPALREDQVMIGIPAAPAAAPSGGYIKPEEMKKALDYLILGKSFGGKYKLSKETGYENFRGLMTWSVNWDAKNNFEFSTNYREYFDKLSPAKDSLKAAVLSSSEVVDGSFTLSISVPSRNTATSYKVLENNKVISEGNLTSGETSSKVINLNISNKEEGKYEYSVILSDANGKEVISNKINVEVAKKEESTLKAAKLSVQEESNGNYTLKAQIPSFNTATNYKLFEGNTVIKSGDLLQGQPSVQNIDYMIKNKGEGTYKYTFVVYNGNSSLISNEIIVEVRSEDVTGDTYDNNKVYLSGDTVIYKGVKYTAKWWVQGEAPDKSAAWQKEIVQNDDGSTNYNEESVYNSGDKVKYNGKVYKAKWWTNSIPGSDASWELIK